jgi:hypothetical protein
MMAAGWWRMHTFRGTWTTGHNAAGKRWCRQTQEAQFGDPVAENHGLGHDGFCWVGRVLSGSTSFCTNAIEIAQIGAADLSEYADCGGEVPTFGLLHSLMERS